MSERYVEVGIVVARRRLSGKWASHAWLPHAVLPAPSDLAAWTRLSASESEELFYAGAAAIGLHRSATGHYRDNLSSGRPSLWVALRPLEGEEVEVAGVTADPYEGEAMAEASGEIIEAVPMPGPIEEEVAAFVQAFHVERPFFKRKRDRLDPKVGGGRRLPGSQGEPE